MAGATCLTNLTAAVCGVHTRSTTSGSCLLIAPRISSSKSAARPAGSTTMSTLPSSAVEILRSSPTSQSVPTPRQSQRNVPSHRLIAAASSSGVSCWFLPSVSKIACRSVAGRRREDLVGQPQPLADRGPAVGPQLAQRRLGLRPGALARDRHRPVGGVDRPGGGGARDDREPGALPDHVHGGRGGRAGLGDLGRRVVHRA